MEDNLNTNPADCPFGSGELDLLIEEWLKVPEPKTINELARLYLNLDYHRKTGYLPYDRRKQYKKGDVISLRSPSIPGVVFLAQVTEMSRKCMLSDGLSYDRLDVILLSQDATLVGGQHKNYISNYQGTEFAGSEVVSLQIIQEKDENEVIPKILTAILNDKRFVAFQQYWLPAELLITNISDKLIEVRKIIAEAKCSLSTDEILGKLKTEDNMVKPHNELSNDRLEFSLNYFLDRNGKFTLIPDSITKWDLLKPSAYVHVDISKKTFPNGHLCAFSDLDNLLFYHGFIDKGVFSFPYDRCIAAVYDAVKQVVSGKEFENELIKLSDEKEFKVRFEQPEQRGDPIRIYPTSDKLDEDGRVKSTVTIREDWIDKGIIIIPKRISIYMEGTNTAHIIYDQVDKVLPYWDNEGRIEGLEDFYSTKAVAEFDRVHLRLEGLDPTRLFIFSTWQRSLDKLLSIEPQDLDWEHSSLRDCIIVTLAKFKTPMHYREIYAEIAPHKNVSLGGVCTTLSHYSPSVFTHVGWGKWQLTGFYESKESPEVESRQTEEPSISAERPDEETWKAVQTIEQNDYVYRLLKKKGRPLNFNDICNELAAILRVDADKLKATGFLNPNDERLRRLDTGEWALEEWFKQPQPVSEENISVPIVNENANGTGDLQERTGKTGISKLFLVILIIVLFFITLTVVAMYWLFF